MADINNPTGILSPYGQSASPMAGGPGVLSGSLNNSLNLGGNILGPLSGIGTIPSLAAGGIKGIVDNLAYDGMVGNSNHASLYDNNPVLQRLYDSWISGGGGTDAGSATAPQDPTTMQSMDSARLGPASTPGVLSKLFGGMFGSSAPQTGAPPGFAQAMQANPNQFDAMPQNYGLQGGMPSSGMSLNADGSPSNAQLQFAANGFGLTGPAIPSLSYNGQGGQSASGGLSQGRVGYAPGADFMSGFGSQGGGYAGGGSYPGLRTLVR